MPPSCSTTEAAKVQSEQDNAQAYDAFTRWLHHLEPDAGTMRNGSLTQISLDEGIVVIDDSTLDKPFAKRMELVTRHWSGKHHAVGRGINLITLLWTDCDRRVPYDYRILDKAKDNLTKNDHFQAMLKDARRATIVDSYMSPSRRNRASCSIGASVSQNQPGKKQTCWSSNPYRSKLCFAVFRGAAKFNFIFEVPGNREPLYQTFEFWTSNPRRAARLIPTAASIQARSNRFR